MYLSLTNNIYKSDNGWILEDYKIYEYVTLSERSLDINPNDGIATKGQMFNISIDSPNLRQITIRNYMKIQELIAKVGGLVKGISIAIQLITFHFLRIQYLKYVYKKS